VLTRKFIIIYYFKCLTGFIFVKSQVLEHFAIQHTVVIYSIAMRIILPVTKDCSSVDRQRHGIATASVLKIEAALKIEEAVSSETFVTTYLPE
jgi:hypothetical protein